MEEAPLKSRVQFIEPSQSPVGEAEELEANRLIARVQAGEVSAFASLYERYFDRVYTYLRVALQDPHAAEDGTQEIFTRALKALPTYKVGSTPFSSWLMKVARNYAINHHRREARTVVSEPAEIALVQENGAEDSEFDLELLKRLSDSELMIFIQRLPLAQRQVIALRFVLDLSNAEVAKVLGRTEGSVRQLQRRAFVFLRKRFAALGRVPATGAKRTPALALPRKARVVRERKFTLWR